jgi:hypothetical protein
MLVEELSPRASPPLGRWCFALICLSALGACSGTLGGGPDAAVGGPENQSAAVASPPSGGSAAGGSCWVTELAAQREDAWCVLAVPPAPNANTSRAYIYVSGDGLRIPRDATHTAGWDYVDADDTAVEVYGPPCQAIRAGAIVALTVTFYCAGVE